MKRILNSGVTGICLGAALATAAAAQDQKDFNVSDKWRVKPTEPTQSIIYPNLPAFGNYPLSVKPTVSFGGGVKISKDINLSAQFETETDGLKRLRSKTPTEAGQMQIGMERAARIKLSIAF